MFGENLKALRLEYGLTQEELARRVGVDRSYISQLEKNKIGKPSYDVLNRIAEALHVPIGYLTVGRRLPPESPEDIVERLRLATPVRIPVYAEFPIHLGEDGTEPLDYVYLPRPEFAGRDIQAFLCEGTCLEPDIADGDTIIVDRDANIDVGNIVATLFEQKLHIGRLRVVGHEQFVENSDRRMPLKDCRVVAKVILSLKWKQH